MRRISNKILKFLFVVLVIVLGYTLGKLEAGASFIVSTVTVFGYSGVFLMSVISGINFLVPVPFITFLPLLLSAGLLYIPTVLVIAMGLTFGDLIGFLVGLWGRESTSLEDRKMIIRLEKIKGKYYWAPLGILFLYSSFAPFSNEVIVVPLGFLRYNIIHIFLVTLAGNIVFSFLSGSVAIGVYSFF